MSSTFMRSAPRPQIRVRRREAAAATVGGSSAPPSGAGATTATAAMTAVAAADAARPVVDLRAAPPLDVDALASSLELSPAAAAAAAAEFDIALAQYMGEQLLAARAADVAERKSETGPTLASPVAVAHASFDDLRATGGTPSSTGVGNVGERNLPSSQ